MRYLILIFVLIGASQSCPPGDDIFLLEYVGFELNSEAEFHYATQNQSSCASTCLADSLNVGFPVPCRSADFTDPGTCKIHSWNAALPVGNKQLVQSEVGTHYEKLCVPNREGRTCKPEIRLRPQHKLSTGADMIGNVKNFRACVTWCVNMEANQGECTSGMFQYGGSSGGSCQLVVNVVPDYTDYSEVYTGNEFIDHFQMNCV